MIELLFFIIIIDKGVIALAPTRIFSQSIHWHANGLCNLLPLITINSELFGGVVVESVWLGTKDCERVWREMRQDLRAKKTEKKRDGAGSRAY